MFWTEIWSRVCWSRARDSNPKINNIPRWAKWKILIIELNRLAALFWALGIVLDNNRPCPPGGPASLHRRRTQSISLYGQFWAKTRCPPPLFLSRYIIYIFTFPYSPPHHTKQKQSLRGKLNTQVCKACSYTALTQHFTNVMKSFDWI